MGNRHKQSHCPDGVSRRAPLPDERPEDDGGASGGNLADLDPHHHPSEQRPRLWCDEGTHRGVIGRPDTPADHQHGTVAESGACDEEHHAPQYILHDPMRDVFVQD